MMNHFTGFDPYVIKERNEQIGREVQTLRLEGHLREDHGQTLSRLVVCASRSMLFLLRRVQLAER
ncbi:MAG: hypothetical protein ACRDTR_12735 [Rubrobacter sp.]